MPLLGLLLVELEHNLIIHLHHDDGIYHHKVLDLDDDKQLGDLENHTSHHYRHHLFQMNYFFAGSVVFAASLVVGV
jgi:hypothetical protein